MQATQLLCPFCSTSLEPTDFFCPQCGKTVHDKPLSTNLGTQIALYAVSIFLPPLFIMWTIKYLKSNNPIAKRIGQISLGLTIISIIVGIFISFTFMNGLMRQVNEQINLYQGIGL